ncbi:MAG: hypothetical protein HY924_02985 [Elusimicrobia bacterium]|nr:hypothetical protein [Elusimicrobiota bacterium]
MPRPQPITQPHLIIRDRREPHRPSYDHRGRQITQRPVIGAPDHVTIVNNVTIINHISINIGLETRRDYHYWHAFDSVLYCHYYDLYGIHWYGFYVGPTYYWTRHHDGRFWWFDQRWGRWAYWHNSHWWYQDPVDITIVYVHIDGRYYRYSDVQNGIVLRPEPVTAPPQPETPAAPVDPQEKAFYSGDGTRLVQVYGERQEAFLYALDSAETAEAEPRFLAFLGQDVAEIRFSNVEDGAPLQILCLLKDGTFALFDADGAPVGQPAPADGTADQSEVGASLTSLKDKVTESIENANFD